MARLGATAVVVCTVEVYNNGAWGDDCTAAQIHRQATAAAVEYIAKACEKDRKLRLVGVPQVRMVVTEHAPSEAVALVPVVVVPMWRRVLAAIRGES